MYPLKISNPLVAQKFQENEVIMNHNHDRLKLIWNLDKEEDFDDIEDLDFVCNSRSHKWDHVRINWADHVAQLEHEDKFSKEYKMSLDAFNNLKDILTPQLQRDLRRSRSRVGISVEIIMGIGLRFLAGGKLVDIRHIYNISVAEAYHSAKCFISAVNTNASLDIALPSTPEELDIINKGFRNKSSHALMSGCVGAIDGFFQQITCPSRKEVRNSNDYYSGHYESHGLNCQAMCDVRLRFLFFGVVAPGKTNDNSAYPRCTALKQFIDNLPIGLYVVGDAAYTLSEHLMTPFTGPQKQDPNKDCLNFHLSQMRIRIEMAFGRLVTKFRLLKKS